MEQQQPGERKKKESPSSLPPHLCSDILSRLPAKSVVRFGCVSKLWSSVPTDSYFTKTFETCSSTRPSLLMIIKERGKLFAFSIPQYRQISNKPRSYPQHVSTYNLKYHTSRYFSFTESVKGLVCFQESSTPIVWNPSIRKFLTLPKPERSWKGIRVFLGYDPIEGKYKVVCFPRKDNHDECRVLTLGSTQESWRRVETSRKHSPRKTVRCINGVVYYRARDDETYNDIIMSFDVRSEKFDVIKLPEEFMWGIIIPYEGRLASVNQTFNGSIKLLILEDAEEHKWSHRYFDAFKHYHEDESLKTNFKLKGITDAGEFIYVPVRFQKSFCILYYDPKGNSFRRVKFEGIADDEFLRRNGLEDISMCELHAIPNHIESLMSF